MNKDFLNKETYITVKLSHNKEIRELNKKYLEKDYPTDVLSFNINEQTSNGYYLGDIIVNVDVASQQADKYEHSLEEEIAELVEHGVLHLLGVHHKDDDENSVYGVKTK